VSTPGASPDTDLSARLADADASSRLLVVIDQLEELFTLCNDPVEREAFARALEDVVQRGAALVVAVRADQLHLVAEVPTLARLVGGNDVLVGPIRERELRDVIVRPAQRAGLQLEEGLVEEILADSQDSSGVLPLVETALLETWIRRTGNVLTLGAYHASGGVRGAVARLAESTYGILTEAQQEAARRILLRLADASDEGTLDLRRRVRVDDVARRNDSDAWVAYEQLVQHRLLTATEDTVEVTHEALLREWPRLREWLTDDVDGRRLHQRLGESARAWIANERDPSELLRGSRLSATDEWATAHDADLNDSERDFLDASRSAAGREIEEANTRADREARSSKRLRRLLAGVALLLVVALIAGVVAIRQRSRAEDSAANARRAETSADADRLSAQGLVDPQLDRAYLSALAAVRLDENVDTRAGLIAAMQRAPNALRVRRFRDARISGLEVSPDGKYLATTEHPAFSGDTTGKGYVLDAVSLETVATFEWSSGAAVTFLPNGLLASVERGDTGARIVLARLDQRDEPVAHFATNGESVEFLASDSTGRYLAASIATAQGSSDYMVWDVNAPQTPVRQGTFVGGPLTFTPDGGRVAIPYDGRVALVDVSTGNEQASFPGTGHVAISPNGQMLAARIDASGDPDANVETFAVYDIATQAVRGQIRTDDSITTSAFGTDNASLLAGTEHGAAVWNLDGTRRLRLGGQANLVARVAVSPSGPYAYSTSLDGTIVRWGLDGKETAFQRVDVASPRDVQLGFTDTVHVAPDGDVYYLSYPDTPTHGVITIRDSRSGELNQQLRTQHHHINAIDFSRDGATIATGGGDARVFLWDAATHEQLASWAQPGLRTVISVDFSPDGRTIAVALADNTEQPEGNDIELLDARTLRPRGRAIDVARPGPTPVSGAAFDPSGSRLAFTDFNASILGMLDPATGREVWSRELPIEPIAQEWSPDGTKFALGDRRGSLMVVDRGGRTIAGPTPAHAGLVATVTFSPDGETLFTTGTDSQVRLWRSRDLRPIGLLSPTDGSRESWPPDARVTDDGRRLLVAVGTKVWDVPIDVAGVREYLCRVVGHDISPEDWAQLLPNRPHRKVCADSSTG
jgi:WD40 repeat protein